MTCSSKATAVAVGKGGLVGDSGLIDGAVNGVAKLAKSAGSAVRRTQTGQLQAYAMVVGVGIIAIVLVILFLG